MKGIFKGKKKYCINFSASGKIRKLLEIHLKNKISKMFSEQEPICTAYQIRQSHK
jgi:hypothetical protein